MPPLPFPILSTDRLQLRPFTLDDAPTVHTLAGDVAVARYTCNIPHPYPEGDAAKWIARHLSSYLEDESLTLALERTSDRALLGAIHLELQLENQRGEIGYWIGQPYWGHGYCTEAAQSLVNYGFKHWPLCKIHCHHLGPNLASGRIMQKIGMTLDGTLREQLLKNGVFHDLLNYSILRIEWEKRLIYPL